MVDKMQEIPLNKILEYYHALQHLKQVVTVAVFLEKHVEVPMHHHP